MNGYGEQGNIIMVIYNEIQYKLINIEISEQWW